MFISAKKQCGCAKLWYSILSLGEKDKGIKQSLFQLFTQVYLSHLLNGLLARLVDS